MNITGISILPHYRHLRHVDLSNNNITDISPLGSPYLSRITYLNLSHNRIENPAINTHKSLQVLNLSDNCISTLSETALSHPFLTRLDLSGNSLEELKGISDPSIPLRFLEARCNKINNCSGLNPNIEELELVCSLIYLIHSLYLYLVRQSNHGC